MRTFFDRCRPCYDGSGAGTGGGTGGTGDASLGTGFGSDTGVSDFGATSGFSSGFGDGFGGGFSGGFGDDALSAFAQAPSDIHGPAVATFGPSGEFSDANFTGFTDAVSGRGGIGRGESGTDDFSVGTFNGPASFDAAAAGLGGNLGGIGTAGFDSAAPGGSIGGPTAGGAVGGNSGGNFGGFAGGGVGTSGPAASGGFDSGSGAASAGGNPGGIGSDFSASGGIGVPSQGLSASMRGLANALGAQESNNNYGALGPPVPGRGRAVGRYQVMPENIGPWTAAALGRAMTPAEFRASPAAQDAVFAHQMTEYIGRFGRDGAIQAWYGGPGAVGNPGRAPGHGVPGPTVGGYTQAILARMSAADRAAIPNAPAGPGGSGTGGEFAGDRPGGGSGLGLDSVGGGLSNAPADFARGSANVPYANMISSPLIGEDRSPTIGPDGALPVGAVGPQNVNADRVAPAVATPSVVDRAGFMPGVSVENARLGPAPGTITPDVSRFLAPTNPNVVSPDPFNGGRGIGSDFSASGGIGLGDFANPTPAPSTPVASRGPLADYDPRNNLDAGIFTGPQDANNNNQGWYTEPGGPIHQMAHFLSEGFRDTRPNSPGFFARTYTDAGQSPEDVYEQMANAGHVPAPLYPGTFDLNSYGVRPEERPVFSAPLGMERFFPQSQGLGAPAPTRQGDHLMGQSGGVADFFSDQGQPFNGVQNIPPSHNPNIPQGDPFGSNDIPFDRAMPFNPPQAPQDPPWIDLNTGGQQFAGIQPFNGGGFIPPSHDPRLAPMEGGTQPFNGVNPISPNMIPPMGVETIPPELLAQFMRMRG